MISVVKTGLDLGGRVRKGKKIHSLEMGIEREAVLVCHDESAGVTNF
jgi:hypothetical protein